MATKKPAPAARPKAAQPATVTLKHLAAELAERHELSKKQAQAVLMGSSPSSPAISRKATGFASTVLASCKSASAPRGWGRNPATGEAIKIKASKKVAFRAAKDLREAI